MYKKKVLFVPTYNYLCMPIMEKLSEIRHSSTELSCLDFFQPRADFGAINETAIFSRRERIHPRTANPGIFEMRRLRAQLEHFLNQLDPALIITFSDVTFFARCIKGTRFEERLLVIQPCLLSAQPPTWKKKFIYEISGLINVFLACPVFREKHYWGELLDLASYCVWGKVERESRKIRGKVLHCGSYFMNLPASLEVAGCKNNVLVLVPDLPYYTKEQYDLLLLGYSYLLETHPETFFEFKYHPRNIARLALAKHPNYKEIEQFSINNVGKYDIIVSSYSNLAVAIRCIHQKIIIFDLGWYADSTIPYLSPDYFLFSKSKNQLANQFLKLKSGAYLNSISTDYLDTFFPASSEFLEQIQEFFNTRILSRHAH